MSEAAVNYACPVRLDGQPCVLRDALCDLLVAGKPVVTCGPCFYCGRLPSEALLKDMMAALVVAKKAMSKLNRAQRAMERFDSYQTRAAAACALNEWWKAQVQVEETGLYVKWSTE